MIFIEEYCLSKVELTNLSPKENSIIVNLYDWNGDSCISEEAYNLAECINVELLTIRDFYRYVNEIRCKG